VPNRSPATTLGTADGMGWLFRRAADYLELLDNYEMKYIISKLEESIKNIEKKYIKEGMVFNNPQETWMDTVWDYDNRAGYRIEIQALQLHMYHLAANLTGKKKYLQKETRLKKLIKKNFWNGHYLDDGFGDSTIRPNVFLAYYIYPELLSKEEWKSCFDRVLQRLWLEWGGLATIDKTHGLYCETYTGKNNRSYHRGDSWFFVNNLAAIAMFNVDADYFMDNILRIIKASTNDIMKHGLLGYASEVSDASSLESRASPAQLWSIATYMELINKVFGLE